MNILLITDLYPKNENETIRTTSYAIKDLVSGLSDFGVFVKKVIIPIPYIQYKTLKINKEESNLIDSIPVDVKTFCSIPKVGFFLCLKNRNYFEKELKNVDLVVAHMRSGGSIANSLYKKFGTPYIYILHNSDLRTLDKQKEILKNAKAVYTRSWSMQKRLEKKGIKVDGVVFSGIEEELIINRKHNNNQKTKFISVNLLQKLKNVDITIKALSLLPKNLDWSYSIIGDGEEYNKLVSLTKELKLEDKIKFLGFKDRKECIEHMRNSDVFIMPSSPETFGLAYLEAMASGCIVICAKGWGVDGLIQNGVNGYTVEARNINEMAQLLEMILTNDQSIIYKNSLNTIKKYTLSHAQKNYANIIKSHMSNKEKYRKFCTQEKNIPLFMQPYWLDSVCEDDMEWDVVLYEKGGEVWGSFVYVIKKKYGFKLITMPKLTQFLGPYIRYPKGQKYYKKLSWEKEIMNYFIDNLPKFDYFNMNFHYSITNWLPFYWKGFKQTTRYTYVIEKNLDLEMLSKNFETDIRRRRKKAYNEGIEVYEGNDIKKFYELNTMTFIRQGKEVPYSFEFIKRLYKSCKKNNACKMFFAKNKDGLIIAGNFLIYDENTVYYLMGGIDANYKDLGGMDIILYESIKFALESGKNFDFEGSMIESIEKYFRSFGAIQKPYFNIFKVNSNILKIRSCLRDIFK